MKIKKLFEVTLIMICLGILLPLICENVRIINHISAAEEQNKVLLFIRHGTSADPELQINEEVNVMLSMLESAGFDVIVASTSGEAFEGKTTKLIPDITLADINVEDYVGLMLPCFAAGASRWHASPEEISLIKKALSLGKPIAAQHGAVIILAEAGALVEKKYAYNADLKYYAKGFSNANAIYSGDGVIQDDNIITSGHCPYSGNFHVREPGTVELTERFIKALQLSLE